MSEEEMTNRRSGATREYFERMNRQKKMKEDKSEPIREKADTAGYEYKALLRVYDSPHEPDKWLWDVRNALTISDGQERTVGNIRDFIAKREAVRVREAQADAFAALYSALEAALPFVEGSTMYDRYPVINAIRAALKAARGEK